MAATIEDSLELGFGLFEKQTYTGLLYVLVDLSKFELFMSDLRRNFLSFYVGMILIKRNEAYDVFEVNLSAARKGYGPLMYEVAMSNRWLMADRGYITKSAENIWRVFSLRDDVKIKPLPIDCPKTATSTIPQGVLSKAYKLTKPKDTSILKQTFQQGLEVVKQKIGKPDAVMKQYIEDYADEFFSVKFH